MKSEVRTYSVSKIKTILGKILVKLLVYVVSSLIAINALPTKSSNVKGYVTLN